MSERNVLSQIESSTKTNLSISAKELFLRFVDPEHHKTEKPRLTEEQQQNKLLKLDSENKLIEQCNNGIKISFMLSCNTTVFAYSLKEFRSVNQIINQKRIILI